MIIEALVYIGIPAVTWAGIWWAFKSLPIKGDEPNA